MELEIDGQICSTKVTHHDDCSWSGVVERKEKNAAGECVVLFRANVEVRSISALIKKDKLLRQKRDEKKGLIEK